MKNTKALKAACIALLASPLLLAPQPANAWSNSKQLAVTTTAKKIMVEGYNQSNRFTKWESSTGSTGNGNTTFKTDGWFWKGNVIITATSSTGTKRVCNINVPSGWQGSNPLWFNTQCGPIWY